MGDFFVSHLAERTSWGKKGHHMFALREIQAVQNSVGCVGLVQFLFVVYLLRGAKEPVVRSGETENGNDGSHYGGKPDEPFGFPLPWLRPHGKNKRNDDEDVLKDGLGRVDFDKRTHAVAAVGAADEQCVA